MTTYAQGAACTLEHPERPVIVVALHGLTGTRAQPLALLDELDAPTLGVLAPDLRAHGETALDGLPSEFTPLQLAADVDELLRRLGLASRRFALLGVSMGATVALELLRRAQLDVVACIFVRPAHGTEPAPHLRLNARIGTWLRDDPATALDRLTASAEYQAVASVSPRAAASLRDKVTGPRAAERAMRLLQGSDWVAFAAGERIDDAPPSLVIAARDDPQHPVGVAESWHGRIRGSELVVLPAWDADPAAHTALARSAIRGFLSRVASAWAPA